MSAERRIAAAALLAACLALSATVSPALAQAPARNVQYTRQTLIRMPFTPDTSGRLKRVLLYVSTDQGREWQPCSEAAPTDRYFRDYIAPGDGTYLFAVRSVDAFDQYNPPSLAQLTPEAKVVVDTRPPVVSLRQADDPRSGVVTVEWDVRDENLDLNRFVLEFRVPGESNWVREERTQPGMTGRLSWFVNPGVRMEVRLRALDRAGNAGEATLPLGLGADGRPPPRGAGPVALSGVEYVNTRTIQINCKISVGISGTRDFDLWYTRDAGRTWVKAPKKLDGPMPGVLPAQPGESAGSSAGVKLIFEAEADGLYGFTVVFRNGVGVGDPNPKPGDPPRFSVEVDTVEPKIDFKVTTGAGADMRNVTIQWAAQDKNLADRPVTLEYQGVGETEWKALPTLAGPQDRSGVHVWTIGKDGPFKFLIRATAIDRAKNRTMDQTKEPIIIDLEHPRVEITGIEPGSPKSP